MQLCKHRTIYYRQTSADLEGAEPACEVGTAACEVDTTAVDMAASVPDCSSSVDTGAGISHAVGDLEA